MLQSGVVEAGCLAAEVGAAVRRLRVEAGVTQSELAASLGTTQSSIARLESGARRPSLASLERVAAALGCGLAVAFNREPAV